MKKPDIFLGMETATHVHRAVHVSLIPHPTSLKNQVKVKFSPLADNETLTRHEAKNKAESETTRLSIEGIPNTWTQAFSKG